MPKSDTDDKLKWRIRERMEHKTPYFLRDNAAS